MRLTKRILFHRVTLVSLSIILQLLVIVGVILNFNDYFFFFYIGSILLSAASVLWIINKRSNPTYKIAWIIPILLFPVFGVLFYIFFGLNKLSKWERRRMKTVGNKMAMALEPQQQIIAEIRQLNETAVIQSKYIQDYAFCPPYSNTFTEYLPTGEVKFERLLEELKKARHFIFLEYFIIKEGLMWESILDVLVEKASKGVDVRVIYDDVGSLLGLPYKYNKKLEKLGIKCCIFNPLVPMLSPKLNNRDHRKIAIIDGHTGFTGGINLADEYINKIRKYGHWKDTAVMIKGDAVWNLTVMFLSMWCFLSGVDEDFSKFKNVGSESKAQYSDGYVQPFTDSPLDDEAVGETVYLNLINKARRYVYITTPYLIIDNEMITALTIAAKGGVDVRIITPYCPDKKLVHEVTRSYYRVLVESGVKIYEYIPGFIHSKTYVADDEYGVVGTINMDYRSLFLHFECGVWMFKTGSVKCIREDFVNTLKHCNQVKMEDIKNIKWYRKFARLVLRIFAPLL